MFDLNFYYQKISNINGLAFTQRELDIISFIISGRTAKKIALILDLSPKTVENYTSRIMQKIECHSQEEIRDFIDKSGYFSALKKLSSYLLQKVDIMKWLKNNKQIIESKNCTCLLLYKNAKSTKPSIDHLEKLMTQLGLKVIKQEIKLGTSLYSLIPISGCSINYISAELLNVFKNSTNLVDALIDYFNVSSIKPDLHIHFNTSSFNDFFQSSDQNKTFLLHHEDPSTYCETFFLIAKKLMPFFNFEEILVKLRIQENQHHTSIELNKKIEIPVKRQFLKNIKNNWKAISLVAGLFFSLLFYIFQFAENPNHIIARSDLHIPNEKLFINRTEIVSSIKNKLKEQSYIKTVAIVGIGGAGKTTLARYIAKSWKSPIIWEINAETHGSIIESFIKLSFALAQTKMENEEISFINTIQDAKEKEAKLINFVKKKLKSHKNWFLIYDNVKSLSEIIDFFPHDSNLWGKGYIILTTQNKNIVNSNYLNSDNIINIESLSKEDAENLFCKISYNKDSKEVSSHELQKVKNLFKEIPHFPLDISVAAYYIKNSSISYDHYASKINKHSKELDNSQKDLVNEINNYGYTRYSLISLAVSRILSHNPEFRDLLILICFLDSQNIPLDLLVLHKGATLVDQFLYELNKFSLVNIEKGNISLHRSIQNISFSYIINGLEYKNKNDIIQNIYKNFDKYISIQINRSDLTRMRGIIRHAHVFAKDLNELEMPESNLINIKLGYIHYLLNEYDASANIIEKGVSGLNKYSSIFKDKIVEGMLYLGSVYWELCLFEKSMNILENAYSSCKEHKENSISVIKSVSNLGNVYRELGYLKKSKDLLEKYALICEKEFPAEHQEMASMLVYLGNTYRDLGDYEKAKEFIERSVLIYEKHIPQNYIQFAWTLSQLGNIYKELNQYEIAIQTLQKSLNLYKNHLTEDHIGYAWALIYLGNIYKKQKLYEKALDSIKRGLLIYRKHFPENHFRVTWALFNLGDLCKDQGKYDEALQLFRNNLDCIKTSSHEPNFQRARILRKMSQIYTIKNDYDKAEECLLNLLNEFKNYKSPQVYVIFEDLCDFYLRKSSLSKTDSERTRFKNKAINYLAVAFQIVKDNFTETSSHFQRLHKKSKECSSVS